MPRIESRLNRLEKALGERTTGDCHCEMRAGVSGWRIVYDDEQYGGVSDMVETCAVCGRPRGVFRVTYDWTDKNKELQR